MVCGWCSIAFKPKALGLLSKVGQQQVICDDGGKAGEQGSRISPQTVM